MSSNQTTTIDVTPSLPGDDISTLVVTGAGTIRIVNTGGASSSEGGMGSSSDDDTSKGDLSKPGEKSGAGKTNDVESEEGFDPIGKNIKEKEKENRDN